MAKDIGKGTVNNYVEDTRTGVSTLLGSYTTPVGTVSDLIDGSDTPRSESSTADSSIAGMPASQLPSNTSVAMTPQEIFDTYNVLAGQVQQYADANAMRAAQAQASYGPLAERVMGGSRTAGLGNYTYNRAIRPNLNSLTASLRAQGVSAALNRQLSEALNQAKNNYGRSYNRYSTGNNNTTNQNNKNWSGEFEEEEKDKSNIPGSDYDPQKYIQGGYTFGDKGNIPGVIGQYPLWVDTPMTSTSYKDYTQNIKDPMAKGPAWVNYLKSIGYTG